MKYCDALRAPCGTVALAALKLIGPLLVAVLALGARPMGPAQAGTAGNDQTTGAAVTYPAGWNLVAFPSGTDLTQVPGPLYTYVPSEQRYEPVQSDQALILGTGFWVYFAVPTTVALGAGSTAPGSAGIIPGQWIMLGDPSGTEPAFINQGATAYTYDPLNGYQPLPQHSVLLPGKGVWVTPAPGSNAVITINPTSIPASDLSSYSLTSPCSAALATQGDTSEGTGETIGEVDGQPVSVCFATGPWASSPAVEGFGCLLVDDKLATLDGGPACGGMKEVLPQGANLFLWVSQPSAPAASVLPMSWNGSGFQSGPSNVSVQLGSDVPDSGMSLQAYGSLSYIACGSDLTLPVASADQCVHQQAAGSAPSLPVVTLPIQACSVAGPEPALWTVQSAILVGPQGFTCTGFLGGDSSLDMGLLGPDDPCYAQSGSPRQGDYTACVPTDLITAVFVPNGVGGDFDLACPYFPLAKAAVFGSSYTGEISCTESLPPGQVVQQLDANSVAFYQPADDSHPSPTFGIVLLAVPGGLTEAVCTLPASAASVCQSVLIAFLTGWGRSYDPAADAAATALNALPWFATTP